MTESLLEQGMADLFKQAFDKGVQQGMETGTVDQQLLNRSEVAKQLLHVDVNTADKYFLYQPDFPFVMVGSQRRYYKPAVHEWLMSHQETN